MIPKKKIEYASRYLVVVFIRFLFIYLFIIKLFRGNILLGKKIVKKNASFLSPTLFGPIMNRRRLTRATSGRKKRRRASNAAVDESTSCFPPATTPKLRRNASRSGAGEFAPRGPPLTRQRACHALRQHEFDVNCPLFSSSLTRDCASLILRRVDAKDLARLKSTCKFFGDERGRGRAMIEEVVQERTRKGGTTTDMPEHFWCVFSRTFLSLSRASCTETKREYQKKNKTTTTTTTTTTTMRIPRARVGARAWRAQKARFQIKNSR